ncbi:MAG: peptidoglycan-associated lipoprotein Pal [Desulfobacteraceae bacterium]|jgi:peptidoglycan-associated lipoprotein
MRKNIWLVLALVLILPAMLFTVSCAKKAVEAEPEETPMETVEPQEDTAAAEAAAAAAAAEQARLEAERLKAEEEERAMMAAKMAFTDEDVYFEFDSASLLPEAQDLLSQKAAYILSMPGGSITIEGHCDERGTDAYNMALGERRAEAAKAFLVNLGVNPSQVTTISYGEENPADPGKSEAAWAKNRRAHFVQNY